MTNCPKCGSKNNKIVYEWEPDEQNTACYLQCNDCHRVERVDCDGVTVPGPPQRFEPETDEDVWRCRLLTHSLEIKNYQEMEGQMDEEKTQVEMLARIIKENPGAIAMIDNDNWRLRKPLPEGSEGWDDYQFDDWYENEGLLADSCQFKNLAISYGYGLMQAMASILNIEVENV